MDAGGRRPLLLVRRLPGDAMSYDDEVSWQPSPVPMMIKTAAFLEQRRRIEAVILASFAVPPPTFAAMAAGRSYGR